MGLGRTYNNTARESRRTQRQRILKTTLRKLALALAASTALGSAQAGVLTFQDVVFTTNWNDNVLTLEIDAARHSGDWSRATMLGALGIKEIGRFDSVALASAPAGAGAWKLNARELNANGCKGGGNNSADKALCLYGAPILLADNMMFTFAFTGAPDLDEPHLKVNFLDRKGGKIGELMSLHVPATIVIVPPPGTPVTPPPTPPGTPPEVVPPILVPPIVELPVVGLPDTNEVPEPRTAALVLAGLALMGMVLRRRS
ncbi:MAG: hypothetical protein JWP72_3312 [Massilia sp.]|jgi:hypothetical protein|nr:hypothetical protein [Massilia sp.]